MLARAQRLLGFSQRAAAPAETVLGQSDSSFQEQRNHGGRRAISGEDANPPEKDNFLVL